MKIKIKIVNCYALSQAVANVVFLILHIFKECVLAIAHGTAARIHVRAPVSTVYGHARERALILVKGQ